MAKKVRRGRRQSDQIQVTAIETGSETNGALPKKMVDFVQEYAYVYKEMRNVFIIAVIMFVVLFGLSYVI